MYCYYCGNKLADKNFCARCGKEVKEIKIDYDKLNFNKEEQAQNESKVPEDILNNIKDRFSSPESDEQETKKDPVEDINEKPESEIVNSQKNNVVDSDKAAPQKSKKPIKVVVRARSTKKI